MPRAENKALIVRSLAFAELGPALNCGGAEVEDQGWFDVESATRVLLHRIADAPGQRAHRGDEERSWRSSHAAGRTHLTVAVGRSTQLPSRGCRAPQRSKCSAMES